MNTNTELPPTQLHTASEHSSQFVFVFITVPDLGMFHQLHPAGNWICVFTVAALLDLLLESGELSLSPTLSAGELNQAVFSCEVRDAHAAARLIWPMLDKIKLQAFAAVYRRDNAEDIARCLFPAGGKDILFDKIVERIKTARVQLDALTAMHAEFTKVLNGYLDCLQTPPSPPQN